MSGQTNPFGDVEKEFEETLARHLAAAKALDDLEDDLDTWTCDFLESILTQLQVQRRPLTATQLAKLNEICAEHEIDVEDL